MSTAPAAVRPIIRHHHERLDGGGYPDRLAGDQIPLLAQIINVVDSFDAMATERSYKGALAPEVALDQLREDVRRGWKRQDLVGAFTALIGESGPKLLAPAPFLLASQRFPRCDAVPQREAVDVRAGAVSDSSSLSSSPRPSDA